MKHMQTHLNSEQTEIYKSLLVPVSGIWIFSASPVAKWCVAILNPPVHYMHIYCQEDPVTWNDRPGYFVITLQLLGYSSMVQRRLIKKRNIYSYLLTWDS